MSLPTSIPPNGADRHSTAAPYAFPRTGNASANRAFDSARVKVGPYVPEPWRGTPAMDAEQAATPRAAAPRFETPRGVTPIVVETMAAPEMPPSYPAPVYFTPLVSQGQDDVVASAMPSDAWALDEAAEQMRALADVLREPQGLTHDVGEAARLFDETASPDLLSAWSNDDMNERSVAPNRMPIPGAVSSIEPWADRARRSGDGNAETAARALEVLARRVRDGEVSLNGYEPRLGDAAALAAALAALLGVRR